jgi:pimeloyl-ACP methyl ester carboxylesterase
MPAWYPDTRHVQVGRNRWSLLEAGPPEGLPVLLFHGLGATKATMLTTVRDLSSDYRVIACDLPGFGDSAKPRGTYDAPWFAARVVELLDVLDIKEAGFIGNSMGGRVAIEMGLLHEERCRGLVLLAPALAFLRFRQFAPFVKFLRPELGVFPVRPTRGMVLSLMRNVFADASSLPALWFEAAVDEFFRVFSKPRGRLAFFAAARNVYLDEPHGEAGFWKRLASLEVPTQFVFGREDPLIPVSFAHYVAEALPNARIAILDNCGHIPQLEEPETTHRLARAVLA